MKKIELLNLKGEKVKDINLKEEGLMDSLAFVELLVRLEEFGIEVAPTEVTYEEIDTPNKIIKYVSERVA